MTKQLATLEAVKNPILLAEHFAQSGYFKDATDISKALVKIVAGQELGITPMAAMTGFHLVQGKPTLSSNLIAGLIKRSTKYDYKIIQSDSKVCILEFFEQGAASPVGRAGFTIEEAEKANLKGKDTWKNYASDMLFARAISRGARRFCPDILNGAPVYTPEDLQGISEATEDPLPAIEAEVIPAPLEGNKYSSIEEARALYELAAAKMDAESVRPWLEENYSILSLSKIPADIYDAVIQDIRNIKKD